MANGWSVPSRWANGFGRDWKSDNRGHTTEAGVSPRTEFYRRTQSAAETGEPIQKSRNQNPGFLASESPLLSPMGWEQDGFAKRGETTYHLPP